MEPSNPTFWPRECVAQEFTVSTTTLLRWEGRGLVKAVRSGDLEGYGPAEIRRLWTILTFQRDLGINLAGIEVILRLRDVIQTTHAHLDDLARTLRSTLEEATSADDSHG
jgi:MerR family transcriptional regulator, heat shock protein HspR